MSTEASVDPYAATPAASAPVTPARATSAAASPGRSLASGIAVFLGGYLLLQAMGGQLYPALAGFGPRETSYVVLVLLQLVFALAVVLAGLWIAPGSAGRKAVASVLVVVVTVIVVAASVARISGALNLGQAPTFTITNPWFMVVLVVGAAWLIVREARLGWLALLPVLVLSPLPFAFSIAGVDFATTQIVLLLVTLLVGLGILFAGRPGRG
jgi:hypothetical protein